MAFRNLVCWVVLWTVLSGFGATLFGQEATPSDTTDAPQAQSKGVFSDAVALGDGDRVDAAGCLPPGSRSGAARPAVRRSTGRRPRTAPRRGTRPDGDRRARSGRA